MKAVSAKPTALSSGKRRITKLCAASSAISLVLSRPAVAMWINNGNGTYSYVSDGLIFAVVLLGIGIAAFVGFVSIAGRSPPSPPKKTADEYNADAVLLAAKRHHTEIMTELRKAEIEAARIEAIHKECGEIIAHDRKVRDLNARLEEKRRSS